MSSIDLVGFCGSLRQGSFNAMALKAVGEALSQHASLEVVGWDNVPPFNSDLLTEGYPASVMEIRERVRQSNGIVIATPEYNFSIPGMFKNLLDWLSRGPDQPLAGKPVALISASPGILGGARVQYELRRVLQCVDARVMNKPEVFIGSAHAKFDANGQCTDQVTGELLLAQMNAFTKLIRQL